MNAQTLKAMLAAVAVLAAAATLLLARSGQSVPEPETATVFPEARFLPQVQLVDQHGRAFSTAALEDRFSLLFFGFTHCPDICPLTLQILGDVRAALTNGQTGAAADDAPGIAPDIIFVSVDPARDTPERMTAYLGYFGVEIIGVTADDETLAPLLAALGVHVDRHEHQGEHYNVIHNPTVYVVGPRAELIAVFGSATDAETIETDYLRIRQRYLDDPPLVLSAP